MSHFVDGFVDELIKTAQEGVLTMPPLDVRSGKSMTPMPNPQHIAGGTVGLKNIPKRPAPTPPKTVASTKPISQLESMKRYGPRSGFFGGAPAPKRFAVSRDSDPIGRTKSELLARLGTRFRRP